MTRTDRAWREWGRIDPYFGVLTEQRFRNGGSREEFFTSGDVLVAQCLERLEERFGRINRHRALDFGSGVGRLSLALSKHFDEVVGLDISPQMIDVARSNSVGRNVSYDLSDDALTNAPGRFDLAFSYIVLQHIDASRGLRIIKAILDKSDAFILHLPFSRPGTETVKGRIAAGLRKTRIGDRMMRAMKKQPPLHGPPMEMNPYPLDQLFRILHDCSFAEFAVARDDQGGVECVVIYGRKD